MVSLYLREIFKFVKELAGLSYYSIVSCARFCTILSFFAYCSLQIQTKKKKINNAHHSFFSLSLSLSLKEVDSSRLGCSFGSTVDRLGHFIFVVA